ncbi:CAP domain-containing protein [Chengkuizengella sediminis]|uniref:CAP domain-containing protein n=1 Tax=Chengkuizengella sediminis TaxID=1885917 RepID=UPI00138A1FEC
MKKYLTRICIIFLLMSQLTVPVFANSSAYPDTKGHWADKTITWAKQKEIISGYQDGKFHPNSQITEAEFLALLFRTLEADVPRTCSGQNWAEKYYIYAWSNDYPIEGIYNRQVRDEIIDRTKVAEILARADGQEKSGADAIQYILDQKFSEGKTSATVKGYAGKDTLTRAEAIQFIKNALDEGIKTDEKKVVHTPSQPPSNNEGTTEQETTQKGSFKISAYEQEVVDLVNVERAQYDLPPLKVDKKLSEVARIKSADMQSKEYFDHTSPTYGSPFDMMRSFGVSYRSAAENIAYGQRTPQEVVNAWMNSSGHRKNILSSSSTHIGVGYIEQGNYWTQMFIGK